MFNFFICNTVFAGSEISPVEIQPSFFEKHKDIISTICIIIAVLIMIYAIKETIKNLKNKKSIFDTIVYFLCMLLFAYLFIAINWAINADRGGIY